MDETYTPPPKKPKTSEEREADAAFGAEAARRLFTPNRLAAGAAALAVGAIGGIAIGQNVTNANNHERAAAIATANYEHDQNILKEIHEKALSKVDPSDLTGIFDITNGKTLYSMSIDAADSLPEYKQADENTKEFINFSIRESAIAQGSYQNGDAFAISRADIDGKKTLIVKDGTNAQLPDVGTPPTASDTLTSPTTH